jgi:hypothetical protein
MLKIYTSIELQEKNMPSLFVRNGLVPNITATGNVSTPPLIIQTPTNMGNELVTTIIFPNGGVISGNTDTTSIAHSIDIYTPGFVHCGAIQNCGGIGTSDIANVASLSMNTEGTIAMNGSNLVGAASIAGDSFTAGSSVGVTGTFASQDGFTITVTNGIVTGIVSIG